MKASGLPPLPTPELSPEADRGFFSDQLKKKTPPKFVSLTQTTKHNLFPSLYYMQTALDLQKTARKL